PGLAQRLEDTRVARGSAARRQCFSGNRRLAARGGVGQLGHGPQVNRIERSSPRVSKHPAHQSALLGRLTERLLSRTRPTASEKLEGLFWVETCRCHERQWSAISCRSSARPNLPGSKRCLG